MSFCSALKNTACIFLVSLYYLNCSASQDFGDTHGFNKGSFYFYWGYNRGFYGKSDIHFSGNNYDFTLKDVRSNDRCTKLGVHPYLEIDKITIPQYNYRLGYCISSHYNVSLGFDHMKYVMNQNQTVDMDGYIHESGSTFDGDYAHRRMELSEGFLQLEHTDGLNYINTEISRMDRILKLGKNFSINSVGGFGAGILYPRTRVLLMDRNLNDEWHVSGYGLSSHAGLNMTFYGHFFLQSTFKGGYINMPDIVTTGRAEDKAQQHFLFLQANLVLGYRFLGK